jgi:hypothetical protein
MLKYINITAICLLLLVGSCREKIDLKLDSALARIVVEGYLTTDTMQHKIILTKSADALARSKPEPVSNAAVTISDGTQTFLLIENPAEKGTYLTDSTVFGIPGKTYSLNISNVDINNDGSMEVYKSSSVLKNQNPVDSISIIYDDKSPAGKGWNINLFARDIGGGRNFYLIKLYKNNVLLSDSAFKLYSLADNSGFEGGYYNGFTAYFLSEERKDERIKKGDTITLEMNGITQDYYRFLLDFIEEYYPKTPIFSGPSANISTNIEPKDKAVGFFAVYSVSRKSMIYK